MTTINLIMGDYTPMEAKETLLDVVNSKINFYKLQNFSAQVRFGKPDTASESRVNELEEARAQIIALIQKAQEASSSLKIESTINVAFEAKGQPGDYVQRQELAHSYQA
ncbi:hypothetical protein FVR03_05535 [Pontibacter qinzhouensis]|uniref:Uncharacterized protein n=1 Tax=Pontibacter qinzhouensis TaxID=2603253 RepID=A0A5C8KAE2_9BACT|nr:hypothetical protein [Pontibacter qinzhouensis]TXK50064.1 hypothetical protein FVR03_05535 [Pontibacter qinzhouensis]